MHARRYVSIPLVLDFFAELPGHLLDADLSRLLAQVRCSSQSPACMHMCH